MAHWSLSSDWPTGPLSSDWPTCYVSSDWPTGPLSPDWPTISVSYDWPTGPLSSDWPTTGPQSSHHGARRNGPYHVCVFPGRPAVSAASVVMMLIDKLCLKLSNTGLRPNSIKSITKSRIRETLNLSRCADSRGSAYETRRGRHR